MLVGTVGMDRVVVCAPRIPSYNTPEDVARSEAAARALSVWMYSMTRRGENEMNRPGGLWEKPPGRFVRTGF